MDDDEGARGAPARAARGERSRTGPHPGPLPNPSPARGEGLLVSPNKNRLLQVRRAGKRKLFDRARKEAFLEWFAATCNVVLSAGKAGVCDKTVYKHLMKDAAFFEAFVQALRVGYLRLEARQMQEAHAPPLPAELEGQPPSPAREEGYEVRILDDAEAEEHFDPQLAMQLLREHRRNLPGSAEKRPAQRTAARAASSEEVVEALAKRLKGFGMRVGCETADPPHPARAAPESPSPRRGEGNR